MWFGEGLGFFVDTLPTTLWNFLDCLAYLVWLLVAVLCTPLVESAGALSFTWMF